MCIRVKRKSTFVIVVWSYFKSLPSFTEIANSSQVKTLLNDNNGGVVLTFVSFSICLIGTK